MRIDKNKFIDNFSIVNNNSDNDNINVAVDDFSLLQQSDSSFLLGNNKLNIRKINSKELKEIDSCGLNISFTENKPKLKQNKDYLLNLTQKIEKLINEIKLNENNKELIKLNENNKEILENIFQKLLNKQNNNEELLIKENNELKKENSILKNKVSHQKGLIKELFIFKRGYYKLKNLLKKDK